MPPIKNKFKNLLKDLKIIDNIDDSNQATNLTKRPVRDNAYNTPKTTVYTTGMIQQTDTLFLPEDMTVIDAKREKRQLAEVNKIRAQNKQKPYKDDLGYRYALVVVDLATGRMDAEPFKFKYPFIVKDCLIRIYKRGILKAPTYQLEVDAGKEFKGDFDSYFSKQFKLRVKKTGRHRQQAVVEGVNSILSKVIQLRQLSEELLINATSREWVSDLPEIVKQINKHFEHNPPVFDFKKNAEIRCTGQSCDLLPEGTLVRVQLDYPITATTDDKKLYGTFRIGDIRFSKEPKPITQIILKPDQPPMYIVGNDLNVAYTRKQLLVYDEKEKQPPTSTLRRHVVKKIIKKVEGKTPIHYLIEWKDNTKSEEPRKTLLQDIPDMLKEFEKSIRKN